MSTEGARTAAFFYALVVFLAGAMLVLSLFSHPPVPWSKVVGSSTLTVVAALLPMIGLKLGHHFFTSERGQGLINWGVVISCGVPLILTIIILTSAEPLAALAMIYVPPLQAAILGVAMLFAALAKRQQD